jgi:hypothetical protein
MYNSELDKVLQRILYFRFVIRIARDKTSTTNTVTFTTASASSVAVCTRTDACNINANTVNSTVVCSTITSHTSNKTIREVDPDMDSLPSSSGTLTYNNESEQVDDLSNDTSGQPVAKKRKIFHQKFRQEWQEKYDFLIEKDNTSFCKICNVIIKGAGFHIKRHANSAVHIKKYNSAKSTPKIDATIKKDPKVCLAERIREVELLIATFLCDNNLPFALVNNLVDLLKKVTPRDEVIQNLKMQRDKTTNLVTQVLGPFSKELIFEKLRKEKFSLIIDETTDIATRKSLVVVARFFEESEKIVKDHFVDLIEVHDATSDGLFNAVRLLLNTNKIPFANVIGLGADNASVMMGDVKGVKQRFREICPHIVVNGCSCHSLHLCASNSCKKLPSTVEQFCRDIYSYFSHSSKRSSELKECQIFCEEKPSKMLYPSQTRWLSLQVTILVLTYVTEF